ncbi:MAG TPA: NAD(P)H-dependent glycerol-3-phosphate dehydrogenase, partial [Paracoccus sp. (in: a-proteobacteria)]|nr:NAD(P)H-dependent glycerol-3-phosphate dehydrogenase [Paracoccus sp. (in: a-proteobacteria)]
LAEHGPRLDGRALVSCAKGIDLATGRSPAGMLVESCPRSTVAVLTGPSFAADIARGLPTALTLACADAGAGRALQHQLATPALRLYRTTDVTGAELGGALKNVIAIAAGAAIGAGLGDSARAAIITRGFAEMARLAALMGAEPDTLSGLSGLGDLILTATSAQSRNFRYGLALGMGQPFDPGITVEGAATARAVTAIAAARGIEMPISSNVARLAEGRIGVKQAMETLLARPLKEE